MFIIKNINIYNLSNINFIDKCNIYLIKLKKRQKTPILHFLAPLGHVKGVNNHDQI